MRDNGWYRVLLPCGLYEGSPVVTLTGWPTETTPLGRPSDAYVTRIRDGLHETYPEMPPTDIDNYLDAALTPGS